MSTAVQTAYGCVHGLLVRAFDDPGELRVFVVTKLAAGPEVDPQIDWTGALSTVALAALDALERHGAVDASFFDALAAAFPRRAADIDAARIAWRDAPDPGATEATRVVEVAERQLRTLAERTGATQRLLGLLVVAVAVVGGAGAVATLLVAGGVVVAFGLAIVTCCLMGVGVVRRQQLAREGVVTELLIQGLASDARAGPSRADRLVQLAALALAGRALPQETP